MSRRQAAARRIWDGSRALAHRIADRAAAWVRHGPTRAHRVVRTLLLLGGLYVLARIVRAAPTLMWALITVWLWRAWRAVAPTPEPEPEQAPADPVLTVLWECLGDRDRVHLSTVLAHLQEHGQGKGWTVTDLRVRLEALGIPVRPKVKVSGVPTRGILAADLPPLSRTVGQETPSGPSPTV